MSAGNGASGSYLGKASEQDQKGKGTRLREIASDCLTRAEGCLGNFQVLCFLDLQTQLVTIDGLDTIGDGRTVCCGHN